MKDFKKELETLLNEPQTKEEIIKRWNDFGFLNGIAEDYKERLAMTYEAYAKYLILSNDTLEKEIKEGTMHNEIDAVSFAILARAMSLYSWLDHVFNSPEFGIKEMSDYLLSQQKFIDDYKDKFKDIDLEAEVICGFTNNKTDFNKFAEQILKTV